MRWLIRPVLLGLGGVVALLRIAGAQGVVASFDWSVPPRYGLDTNPADGVIDAMVDPASISPPAWRVDFDACASTGEIGNYRWTIDGTFVSETAQCDGFSHQFPAEGSYFVSLEVVGTQGGRSSVSRPVVVQDWLIIGLGDSYGSGEGNPDVPIAAGAVDEYLAAAADLDSAQAALDAAAAAARQAQERAATLVREGLEVQRRVEVLERRLREQDEACDGFPTLQCIAATARVADATGDVLVVLVPLGLEALIDDPGSIMDAIQNRINEAIDAVDVSRAAVTAAASIRNAARVRLDAATDALQVTWQDRRCHRSANAGQAQAALRIEQADPRTSVTFIHLSCSGGRITAGLLEEDQGIDSPSGAPPIPPQLPTAATLRGEREVDAVLVSVGGNDLGFSKILQSCIAEDPCHDPPTTLDTSVPAAAALVCAVAEIGPGSAACFDYFDDLHDPNENAKDIFDAGIAELPGLYDRLDGEVRRVLSDMPSERFFLTEYPNLTRDEQGDLCVFDPLDPLAMLPGIRSDEADWAESTATVRLNGAMADAVARHEWTYVGGLFDQSTLHGYCAADPWLVRLQETFLVQGDAFGTIHPNAAGHAATADLLVNALRRDFYINGEVTSPRLPVPTVACAGDCNRDHEVTIEEVVLSVSIALGLQPTDSCTAIDTGRDGSVTIEEILQAVGAAQLGC